MALLMAVSVALVLGACDTSKPTVPPPATQTFTVAAMDTTLSLYELKTGKRTIVRRLQDIPAHRRGLVLVHRNGWSTRKGGAYVADLLDARDGMVREARWHDRQALLRATISINESIQAARAVRLSAETLATFHPSSARRKRAKTLINTFRAEGMLEPSTARRSGVHTTPHRPGGPAGVLRAAPKGLPPARAVGGAGSAREGAR